MNLSNITQPVLKDLNKLEAFMKKKVTSVVPLTEEMSRYVLKNGGKRVRPILCLLVAKMLGVKTNDPIYTGAAIEFSHTASLLHDDVIDEAKLRRGEKSANHQWTNTLAVLAGDFFYCRAIDILLSQNNMRILRLVTDAITKTTEGEIFEIVQTHNIHTTEKEYLKIIEGKTAALISASTESGAIWAGASEKVVGMMKKFGWYLGLCFQLADDLLDYTATHQKFGKEVGIDLKEGKPTLPLLVTYQRSSAAEKKLIESVLGSSKNSKQDIKRVLDLVHTYKGLDETKKLSENFAEKAKALLSGFPTSAYKNSLLGLADYIIGRDY